MSRPRLNDVGDDASPLVALAWHSQIPLVADVTKSISADYGVLLEDIGIALRGLFIIDPQGVLQQIIVNGLSVGRSVEEAIRLLQAYQFVVGSHAMSSNESTSGYGRTH